jgi:hypothetical protein
MEAAYASSAEETALEAVTDRELRIPFYCEENVWRLAWRKRAQQPHDRFWVVFISNSIKNVPMFQQRASANGGDLSVCWDYHVILLCQHAGDGQVGVYDMDSLLPYPCPLDEYLTHSFPYQWPFPFGPMFRVVLVDAFLSHFASDRAHMIKNDGQWQAPPPSYPPIGAERPSNLKVYLRFDGGAQDDVFGKVLSKEALAGTDFTTFLL